MSITITKAKFNDATDGEGQHGVPTYGSRISHDRDKGMLTNAGLTHIVWQAQNISFIEEDTMKKEQLQELLYQALETEAVGVQVYETALRCAINDDLKKE